MDERRAEHEAFLRRLLDEIAGLRMPADDYKVMAEALNERGAVSRRGRPWSAETLKKFLASPGVKRLREPTRPGT